MPHLDPKHRAKRWNERVKLTATLLNSSAIVTVAAAAINPIANKHYDVLSNGGWILLFAAVVLHSAGWAVLHFFAAED